MLLFLLGVGTSIQGFISTFNMPSHDVSVAKWDENVSALSESIPFERGRVGFISNNDIPGIEYARENLVGEYILTQYAIAPIVLVFGTDQEWNILSLTPAAYKIWNDTNADHFEVTKFGGKLYLAHRIR
ncbi:MAG: hypothetical protein HYZ23_04730 [Chloroflexi bacterium]|nr:hypothetical protein [Chloroflexota bacterium]